MTPGLDVLTRSHVFLVEAIASLIDGDPSLRGRVELHLAGTLTDADRAIAAPHEFVRMRGLLATPRRWRSCGRPTCCSCRCTISLREAEPG